jgi:hypothetical protein
MKKLLILLATISVALLTSCDKELNSLEGTRWGALYEYDDGSWIDMEIYFGSTHATITDRYSDDPGKMTTLTGTYTFDPPNFEITGDTWIDIWTGGGYSYYMGTRVHTGTIEGRTLTYSIWQTDDIIYTGELERR